MRSQQSITNSLSPLLSPYAIFTFLTHPFMTHSDPFPHAFTLSILFLHHLLSTKTPVVHCSLVARTLLSSEYKQLELTQTLKPKTIQLCKGCILRLVRT